MTDADKLSANRAAWNAAAPRYADHANGLPYWGPYHVGEHDATLLGPIEGRRFFELGFGAGYSIQYLMEHGAAHVTAVDISERQKDLAEERNAQWIADGRVALALAPMEQRMALREPVDVVLSIYALGWAVDLAATLANVASYLKPEGRLVFSWEHPLYPITEYRDGAVHFHAPYFSSGVYEETRWQPGSTAFMHSRTVADWFAELRRGGFQVERYLEPPPEHFSEKQQDVANGAYYFRERALTVPATMIFVCSKLG